MTIENKKRPSGREANACAAPAPSNEMIASYRAGLLCGLETAAQWLEMRGNSVAAIRIRKIMDEEILAGGAK